MLKKIKLSLGLVVLSGVLVACGATEEAEPEKKEESQSNVAEQEGAEEEQIESAEESKYPFPENTQPVGDATISVSTPSGDSLNGNVPVLFVSKDDAIVQIGFDAENFQGDKETFVYINEKYVETAQIGEMYSSSLNLSGETLKPGQYTVTAVQFENNDPTQTPVTFVQTQYEVKEGS